MIILRRIHARAQIQRHEVVVNSNISNHYNKIKEELENQTNKTLNEYANQSKTLNLIKYLVIIGILMNIIILIRLFI